MLFNLNVVELIVGFCIQIPFYYILGLWMIPLGVVSSILWALGGAEKGNKAFRGYGVPIATIVALMANMGDILIICAFIPAWVFLRIGYGAKSWLWCLYFGIRGNHQVADYLTRMTLYILYWVSFGVVLAFCR
jgi:hypothetical protein